MASKIIFKPSKPIVIPPTSTSSEKTENKKEGLETISDAKRTSPERPKSPKKDSPKKSDSKEIPSTKKSPLKKEKEAEKKENGEEENKNEKNEFEKRKRQLVEQETSLKKTKTESLAEASSNLSSHQLFKENKKTGFGQLASKANQKDFSSLLEQAKEESSDKPSTSSSSTYQPVAIQTGEEDEHTVQKTKAELKIYDSEKKEWKNRGSGPLHLNIAPVSETTAKARLVMRNVGTLALLLNVALFPGFSIRFYGEKSVVFGAIENGKIINYAVKFENRDVAEGWIDLIKEASQPEKALELLQTKDYSSPIFYHHEPESEALNEEEEELDDEEGDFDTYTPV